MSKTVEFVELSNGAKLLNMGFADQDFFMESASVETKSFQFGIDGRTAYRKGDAIMFELDSPKIR